MKGSVVEPARREVLARVEAGRLERARLEGRLGGEHAPLLEADLRPDAWYPLRAWERMVSCLLEAEGSPAAGGADAEGFLAERGRRLAEALLRGRASSDPEPEERAEGAWWEPVGFALVALPASLLSHTSWVLLPFEPWGRFAVSVTGAEDLPEAWRHLGRGLLEGVAARLLGAPLRITSARPERDRLVFHGRP